MAKSASSRLASQNKKIALENSALRAKANLLEQTLANNMSGFTAQLTGQGGGMSNLTSMNPSLQNNMYAPMTLMWTNLMYMYRTHGLLQTAIDMPVLDALRGGLDFHSNQLDSDDIGKLEDYLEENNVLERIGDAFVWARLFGGAALIINTESDCEEPIGGEVVGGKIEFYDACRWELTSERRIPASGKYGYYGKKLDKSRVITILGKRAPWLIRAQLSDWGMSELERMIEDFNLFLRTRNVIYEILQEAKVDVYSLKGFAGQLASPSGTQRTAQRVQQMNMIKDFNNALIMDEGDKYEQKVMNFGGLSDMMKESRMGIASALRMPMSKLFGIPSTGLSGSGEDDIENYNGLIESEVRQPMKHIIRKVLQIVVKNQFGEDLDINFKFKPLRILNGTDEESIKTSKTTRFVSLFEHMVMDSKELGEVLQKENLVPIPLKAEKGLLEDHPLPITAIAGEPKPSAAAKEEVKDEEGGEGEGAEGVEEKKPGEPADPSGDKKKAKDEKKAAELSKETK